jgi:LPXTG-site transpeptidase (sortase) family protein
VKLSRINTLLLVGIILVNGITIGMPFLPSLLFKAEAGNGAKQQQLHAKIVTDTSTANQPNSLIMPSALFDQQVFDGPDARTLRNGVWHRPNSSTPDKGGNTVFAAHRFTYSNPRGAFYNLDKLRVGDLLAVVWNHKTYQYTVRESKVVGPHDDYIENQTDSAQLTLYTCTPLTLPKNRLVVIATPVEPDHE